MRDRLVRFKDGSGGPVATLSREQIERTLALMAEGKVKYVDDETPEKIRERLLIELRIRELGL